MAFVIGCVRGAEEMAPVVGCCGASCGAATAVLVVGAVGAKLICRIGVVGAVSCCGDDSMFILSMSVHLVQEVLDGALGGRHVRL
jgi:hypothetical protein